MHKAICVFGGRRTWRKLDQHASGIGVLIVCVAVYRRCIALWPQGVTGWAFGYTLRVVVSVVLMIIFSLNELHINTHYHGFSPHAGPLDLSLNALLSHLDSERFANDRSDQEVVGV